MTSGWLLSGGAAGALVAAMLLLAGADASACPFCTALEPTLTQRRQVAAVVALGEVAEAGARKWVYRLHHLLKGRKLLASHESLEVAIEAAADGQPMNMQPGTLVLVLGNGQPTPDAGPLTWSFVPVNEAGYAYIARAPSARLPAHQRLPYFLPYLEHREPLVAEDAYLEFAHAPYDEVARIADRLPMKSLRDWLLDEGVPPRRKGFYGLALGLARGDHERSQNIDLLVSLITRPADDFRGGFDGVLGGYLVAAGGQGLALIENEFLANPDAAEGDVRHALTALRFYHEYGRQIPLDRLQRAFRRLLDRPRFAADAIVDLARLKDWEACETIAGLYGRPDYADAATERAIIGYLMVCPTARASAQLARLRQAAPQRVAEAEAYHFVFGGRR